jgi:hypothetical protein
MKYPQYFMVNSMIFMIDVKLTGRVFLGKVISKNLFKCL